MSNFMDLTRQTFNLWTVISRAEDSKTPGGQFRTMWLCECQCGTIRAVSAVHLRNRSSKSCGCSHHQRKISPHQYHGLRYYPEYNVFKKIQLRCNNPSNPAFSYYGGRGIACEWQTVEEFYRDMGPRPSPLHTVERRDNRGPYAAWNCYWATRKEQGNNKRNNRLLTFGGVTQTLSQWAAHTGISYSALKYRLKKMSIDEALAIPYPRKICGPADEIGQ